jgi:cytochrome c oxidase assembly protein subunit 15
VIANVVIVVTGGAVRLSGSGLGCPTWPSCTENSLTPTKAAAVHGLIEVTNRGLSFVLSAVVIATLVAAVLAKREIRLAVLLAASVPAQAVLGGVTVLTQLNPWTVAAHFLLSMAIIAIAFALWWRASDRHTSAPTAPLSRAATGLLALALAVLALGTVVTGSGPHAGDKGATHRIHFSPGAVAHLHADAVMLLVGVTIGLVMLVHAAGGSRELQQAAAGLLAIELTQALIGFVQYATHVPAMLVGIHLLGACLVWIAALRVAALAGARIRA